jgi:hypothetical protein
MANDSHNLTGPFASVFSFNVSALISISLPNNSVEFGVLVAGAHNDTVDNSPLPFLIQNDGNSFLNVTILSTDLWNTEANPTLNYTFKADNNTFENLSFNVVQSQTTFAAFLAALAEKMFLVGLNYTNATDTAEIDLNVSVPLNEGSGYKNATITFTATLGE